MAHLRQTDCWYPVPRTGASEPGFDPVPVASRSGPEPPALAVRNLTVSYGHAPVLLKVDYSAPLRGLTAVAGPNGAGKSTFLKACLGLVPILTGEIRFFGQPLAQVRQRVSYMPQRSSLDWQFPISVVEVAVMGRFRSLGWFRRVNRKALDHARASLAQVGMDSLADQPIGQLSGGQQQRVLLARALAQDADLYLMDEPFAGVDAATESAILSVLESLAHAGKTVICVHHDLQSVSRRFDNLLLLNTTRIADGPTATTLTHENLGLTYGAALQGLDQIALDRPDVRP